jgi:hypothetical protein
MATIARDRERSVLYLLCGLLSDEEVWREVVQRVQSVATVHTVAFDGLSSMHPCAGSVRAGGTLDGRARSARGHT